VIWYPKAGQPPWRRISAAPPDRGCDSSLCINAYQEQPMPECERPTIEIFGDDVRGHDNEYLQDEEKILAGQPDANMPAHLTKDVPGG
jgi:hypothetical protein